MTISSTVRIAGPFTGNGVTTTFPFTYKVFSTADVQVIQLTISTGVETTLTIVTDYNITLNGDQDSNPGGNIVLVTALLALYKLTATSDIANLQPTDLTNQGGFYPEVITDALDRATIQIQQISDIGDRTLKIPISDGLLNMELPTTTQRINTILGFDAAGLPTVLVPQASSITGNTVIVGTLDVTSATTLQTTLGVTGAATLASVGVTGAATVGTTLGVTGDATIQGLTVGKGGGSISTNSAFGYAALNSNTTGNYNNAFGYSALAANTTGYYNNAFGYAALNLNTTGYNNNAFGQSALASNTAGSDNNAFGKSALASNTTGSDNNAFGTNALASNTTGSDNYAFGTNPLYSNTSGNRNCAFGRNALNLNTIGNYNNAFGYAALQANTTSNANSAFGYAALASNTTGSDNNAFGYAALNLNTTGAENCAFGFEALVANTIGVNNTAFGNSALHANVTGSSNTAVGLNSLLVCTGSNNTALGGAAGNAVTSGSNNTAIGYNAQILSPTLSNQIQLGNGSVSSLRCQVVLTAVSDERDKTNIVEIPVGLNLISKIRPVSFEWNQRDGNRIGRKEFGFTAQQLQTAQTELGIEVPYLVDNENSEHLGVSASHLIPVLVKAIQELNAKFEAYVATHP